MDCYGFKKKETIKKYGLGKLPPMSNDDYRKIDALSASDIKEMMESIDRVVKRNKLQKDESDAMNRGTALHEAILEPEKFRFSAYRFKPKEANSLKKMINNAKVIFGDALYGSETEVGFLAEDDVFLRKCRCDAYNPELGIIFDVKTTRYGDKKTFYRNDIIGRHYDVQAAWYMDVLKSLGYKADHFVFLCVQNMNPYNCFAVEVHDSIIEKGRSKYGEVLEKYQEYCKHGKILDIHMVYDWEYLKTLDE